MELKQLQFFMASAKSGSFRQAARELYTTQPNVSKTVRALEEELHTTLLERNPRGVTLTEKGREVYEYARNMLPYASKIMEIREREAEEEDQGSL